VFTLSAQETARLQVIHNAPDPAAASVDIYLNGALLLDDFGFRKATPFIDAPANTPFDVGVAAGNSSSAADTLKNFTLTLEAGKTYLAIADGVLNPDNFPDNPDGLDIGFTLYPYAMGRESGEDMSKVDLNVFHGSTNAPTVDVFARDVGKLVDDAGYGDFSGYFSVPAGSYILDITPGNDNSTVVASFTANLTTLEGRSAVVFASGFFTPDQNQNGAAFGLFAALDNGEVIQLQATSTRVIEEEGAVISDYELEQNYPNPFNPTTTIAFALPKSEFVTLTIYNALGQQVMVLLNREFQAGRYQFQLDARDLTSGIYTYRLTAGDYTEIRRMTLLK
jgi:hypothetical protein